MSRYGTPVALFSVVPGDAPNRLIAVNHACNKQDQSLSNIDRNFAVCIAQLALHPDYRRAKNNPDMSTCPARSAVESLYANKFAVEYLAMARLQSG
jgi:hypothetical protein